jgi:hypothetical protein
MKKAYSFAALTLLAGAGLLFLIIGCFPDSPTEPPDPDAITGYGLNYKSFVQTGDAFNFSWDFKAGDWGDVDYDNELVIFEILRKDPGGQFRPIGYTFGSTEKNRPPDFGSRVRIYRFSDKRIITDGKNEYSDVPPPYIFGELFYSVRAIINPAIQTTAFGDTLVYIYSKEIGKSIYGDPLLYDVLDVGNIGGMYINDNAVYASTDTVKVSFDNYREIVKFKLLSAEGDDALDDDQVRTNIKNEDWIHIPDTLNRVQIESIELERAKIMFNLLKGGERKKWVYMQSVYLDGDTTIKKDFIRVADWFADIFVLDESRSPMIKTRRTYNFRTKLWTVNIAAGLSIPFELSIPSDTTFIDTFWVWAVTRREVAELRGSTGAFKWDDDGTELMESEPARFVMPAGSRVYTGVYTIPNTFLIKTTSKNPVPLADKNDDKVRYETAWDTIPLEGTPSVAAGKEFGWLGKAANTKTSHAYEVHTYKIQQTLMNISPSNYIERSGTNLAHLGYKEFLLIARLKGKYFNENRYILSDHWNHTNSQFAYSTRTIAVWDRIPPAVNFEIGNQPTGNCMSPDLGTNLLSVDNIFTVCLAWDFNYTGKTPANRAIFDGSGGRVRSVTLKFNYSGPDTTEEFWSGNWRTDPVYPVFEAADGSEISANTIMKFDEAYLATHAPAGMSSHYVDGVGRSIILNLRWEDIDASTWKTGYYRYWVETEDEFGNYGYAPPNSANKPNFNIVYINTGL